MNTHPDILELELSRTGEASAETASHLASCEACQAQLTGLEELGAGLGGEVPEITIPAAVDQAVAAAAEEAARRARSKAPTADAPLAEVIRPSVWRKLVPVMGAVSAAAAVMLFFVSVAGDNVRSLFGASADALAGSESLPMSPAAGAALEGHKSLSDFSETTAVEAHEATVDRAPSVVDTPVGGEAATSDLELSWAPEAPFSGTLELRVRVPAGARIGRVTSPRAGDRAGYDRVSETELLVRLIRAEPSAELVSLQLSVSGGTGEGPRLLSSELRTSDGEVRAVPLRLMKR